ncbi:MAG: hypothetical protein ACLR8U_08750 [Oscillospiraceae bacterium]
MDSVTQSYSVLLVSASAKFMDSVLPLLPERSFSPITKAPDVSSARRCLLERSYDLLIINAPLPDEFGTNFALDICQSTQTGVLLLVRAEQYPDVTARVCQSGVLTLQKPTSPRFFLPRSSSSAPRARAFAAWSRKLRRWRRRWRRSGSSTGRSGCSSSSSK